MLHRRFVYRYRRFRHQVHGATGRQERQLLEAHLHDDLGVIRLPPELTNAPPLEVWPRIVRRTELPADVESLLSQLQDAA